MYSVRLGYDKAVARIRNLIKNGHYAEALVTSVFTIEKTLCRTLKQLIVSSGFPSRYADVILKQFQGLDKIKKVWPCFDPNNEGLPSIIGDANWQIIPQAQTMRNKLVHGERVYTLNECHKTAVDMLSALDATREAFNLRYGFDGWSTLSVRIRSALHKDPRVKT